MDKAKDDLTKVTNFPVDDYRKCCTTKKRAALFSFHDFDR
jgi:hypothetical protein